MIYIDAVRRNPMLKNVTNLETEKQIKEWLRVAPDRDGGKQKRDEKRLRKQLSGVNEGQRKTETCQAKRRVRPLFWADDNHRKSASAARTAAVQVEATYQATDDSDVEPY
jgi:hypothetical protein